jgi:predicted nucleotidyltransferase
MDERATVTGSPKAEGDGMTLAQLRVRRDEIVRVAAAHDAHNVRVFGSVALGDADAGSDVDVLVDIVTNVKASPISVCWKI